FRSFCTDTFLDRAWMWTVRQPARVKGEASPLYPFTAHEVSLGIVEDFINVDIAVIIRSWYGQGVVVEQARDKRADDIVVPLKGLMQRRGLVDSSRDRFEVMTGKGIGP